MISWEKEVWRYGDEKREMREMGKGEEGKIEPLKER
jgi:hypothetical protein